MNIEMIDLSVRGLVGILAGGFASFMLGGLWYMLLFNKRWLAATGRTAEDFEGESSASGMILTLLGCFVSTAVLALVYQWAGGSSVLDGIIIGLILGVGIAAVEGMKKAIYNFDTRVKPWALYSVDVSYSVLGMVLAGAVYALIV